MSKSKSKFIEIARTVETTVTFEVVNAEVLDCAYSRNGKQYLPTRLRVKVRDGSRSGAPVLSGPRILKDGDLSDKSVFEHSLFLPELWPDYVWEAVDQAVKSTTANTKEA